MKSCMHENLLLHSIVITYNKYCSMTEVDWSRFMLTGWTFEISVDQIWLKCRHFNENIDMLENTDMLYEYIFMLNIQKGEKWHMKAYYLRLNLIWIGCVWWCTQLRTSVHAPTCPEYQVLRICNSVDWQRQWQWSNSRTSDWTTTNQSITMQDKPIQTKIKPR